MATEMSTTRKKRVRLSMDVSFSCEAEKDTFTALLSEVRDRLTPCGYPALNNRQLLLALFELAGSAESTSTQPEEYPSTGSVLRSSGMCSCRTT